MHAEKSLWYESLPILSFSRAEFATFLRTNGLAPVHLGLDDPILTRYQVLRIRLWNEATAVSPPPRFQFSAGSRLVKILDVTGTARRPRERSVPIEHNIPRLRWRMPEDGEAPFRLAWDGPHRDVAGYHVYQSGAMHVGFGRVNTALLTTPEFTLSTRPAEDAQWRFIRVSTVSLNGRESELSGTLAFRDLLGFAPTFENTIRILSRTPGSDRRPGTNSREFDSPAEVLRQKIQYQAVVVDAAQESETRRLLGSESVRVYTEQNLEFLQGSVRFSLPEGIDSGSEVEVQVYVKASPGVPIIPSLETAADTKLALRRKGAAPRLVVDEPRGAASPELSLTPPVARSLASPRSILVLWEAPESPDYAGVTLRRARAGPGADASAQPLEIYRGRGATNAVILSWKRDASAAPAGATPAQGNAASGEEIVRGFSFEDTAVPDDGVYQYTLVAHDRMGNPARPIVLNASLRDRIPGGAVWRRVE